MTTKEIRDGLVYARTELEGGGVELRKADPRLVLAAPIEPATPGHVVTVSLELRDFDGELRSDSLPLALVIGGTVLPVELTEGRLSLEIELHDSASVALSAGDFAAPMDITMAPFVLEVIV